MVSLSTSLQRGTLSCLLRYRFYVYSKSFHHSSLTFAFLLVSIKRDYASSGSLVERIGDDLHLNKKEYGDLLYSLFLDDGANMTGRQMRFACGILVDKKGEEKKQSLLDMNEEIRVLQEANTDEDPPALTLWKQTSYESTSLPSVDAAVVQFPCSNGIVSSLVLQYRVSSEFSLSVCQFC